MSGIKQFSESSSYDKNLIAKKQTFKGSGFQSLDQIWKQVVTWCQDHPPENQFCWSQGRRCREQGKVEKGQRRKEKKKKSSTYTDTFTQQRNVHKVHYGLCPYPQPNRYCLQNGCQLRTQYCPLVDLRINIHTERYSCQVKTESEGSIHAPRSDKGGLLQIHQQEATRGLSLSLALLDVISCS